jgi:Holliday junction resolvase RusA-like endonuclease
MSRMKSYHWLLPPRPENLQKQRLDAMSALSTTEDDAQSKATPAVYGIPTQ